ncbi:membrane-targeted effector domain-containing toxin [Legionella sp. km772]|uniref:membrane-targeted effector domain-containing toxin n=1 Tax=Legionella sp. km772 TaxID=2498111 RepID=UPI000F8CDD0D|nr:membrane-targeted effector domain-containing toxin [Legionella sp. km772]RUR09722.1 hypothetical protein ELY15_08885 [Legionella sp. km772]
MYSKEDTANDRRKEFCQSIVPTTVEVYNQGGTQYSHEYLEPTQFAVKLDEFFSQASRVPPKPLEKSHELFDAPFIVGESHSHISPKKFLIENMKQMKAKGCEILFMEHLFYDTNQQDLDEFFLTGKFSANLMARLKDMNRSGMEHSFGAASNLSSPLWKENDYIAVLKAAREAGIRVVGIDISSVYKSQKIGVDNQQLDDTRISYMNYTAAKIMEREISTLPKDKQWCAFMGNAHVNNFNNIPGVSELLGARSVFIFDNLDWTTKPPKSSIDVNGAYIYAQGQQVFKGELVYQTDPRLTTVQFDKSSGQTCSIYKQKLNNLMTPETGLTANDLDLAVKYLANLNLKELVELFGFNSEGLDNSYDLVQKLYPINEKKPIGENTVFSIIVESHYSGMQPYIFYLSKEQIMDFSAQQKEAEKRLQLN